MLLTDRFFAGSDTLATTYALAQAIRKIGEMFGAPDIVFAGKQTIDGDTAQVGPGVAKRLDLLQLTYVSAIVESIGAARTIMLERRSEGGTQVLQTRLPCLITMLEGSNVVRRGAIEGRLARRPRRDRHLERQGSRHRGYCQCGLQGSPTVVKKVFAPPPRSERAILVEPGETAPQAAESLIETLFKRQPALEQDLTKSAAEF